MKNKGIDSEKIAAMIGGGAASSLVVNTVIWKNLPDKWKEGEKAKFIPGAAKIALGVIAMSQKNRTLQDAGIGAAIFGGIELVQQLAPSVFQIQGTYRRNGDYLDMGAPSVHGYLNAPRNYRLVDDMEELHQVSGQHRLFNDGDDAVSGLVV